MDLGNPAHFLSCPGTSTCIQWLHNGAEGLLVSSWGIISLPLCGTHSCLQLLQTACVSVVYVRTYVCIRPCHQCIMYPPYPYDNTRYNTVRNVWSQVLQINAYVCVRVCCMTVRMYPANLKWNYTTVQHACSALQRVRCVCPVAWHTYTHVPIV